MATAETSRIQRRARSTKSNRCLAIPGESVVPLREGNSKGLVDFRGRSELVADAIITSRIAEAIRIDHAREATENFGR
jgi:hypothetical protein